MMRKFELCFDFEGLTDQRFLIPELLPKEEPELSWTETNCLAFQYHYNFLPGSVISRFMVRMHTFIFQNTYWRSGVVLMYGNNQARVKADHEEKKISILITGPERGRRILLAIIRSHFDYIHRTIPKIEAREVVTLPDRPDIEIDYIDLLKLEERGIEKYYYPKADAEINVKKLLDGIESIAKRRGETEYHLGNIHTLLTSGFSVEDLRTFCLITPDFNSVRKDLPLDAGKNRIITTLIEYAEQKLKMAELLAWAKEQNPARYEQHQPYFSE